MKRIIVFFLAVAVLVSGAFFVKKKIDDKKFLEEAHRLLDRDTIYNGIKIAGIDVGGLSKEAAQNKITTEFTDAKLKQGMKLKFKENEYDLSMEQLGLKFDLDSILQKAYEYGREGDLKDRYKLVKRLETEPVDMALNSDYDTAKVRAFAEELKSKIDRPMENGEYKFTGNGFEVSGSQVGYTLDVDKTVTMIMDNIGKFNTIDLPVTESSPEERNEQLKRVNGLIGTFTTSFSGSTANRKENIRISTAALSNRILMPGESLSFNSATGPRSAANGYKDAGVIIGDELQSGTGGGVCQTSTTLYNALLRADVTILQRSPHSIPVGYVPRGTDGAVAYGSLDLVFRNDKDYPIFISGYISGDTVTFKIYGDTTEKNYQVNVHSELVETVPYKTVEKHDDSKAPGFREVVQSGRIGYKYKTTKSIVKDGEVISSKVISNDYYRGRDEIVVLGPAKTDANKPADKTDNGNKDDGDSGVNAGDLL